MTKTQNGNIDFTFRMLYVLAIFMIVDGHIGSFDYLALNGLFPYQNYHMALFIFASGYFINLKRTYKEFVSHKFMKLIAPRYIWNFIYGLIVFLLNRYGGFNLGGAFSLYNLLYAPIVDGHQFIYNMGAWFLIPLFGVQLVSFCILKPFARQNDRLSAATAYGFFIFSLLLGAATLEAAPANSARNIFLTAERIFYFLPFYALGVLYRVQLKQHDTLNSAVYFAVIISATIVLRILFPACDIIPAWIEKADAPAAVIFAISLLAVFFWLRIAKILSPLIKNSPMLLYISTHTFDIMLHHFVGFMLVKAALSPLGSFDSYAFKNNIWYYHFPFAENLVAPVYILITIVIALFTGFTSRKIYSMLEHIIKRPASAFMGGCKMKSNQNGRSMIEMLGVLAIVGVLSVGGVAGYSKAMTKAKNNRFINDASELVINIRTLYVEQRSYEGITTGSLINSGFVPREMLDKDSAPSSIKHVYGGNVLVFDSKTPNGLKKAFELYFTGLEKQPCIYLATMDWGSDPASGFQSIYAGTAEVTAPLMEDVYGGTPSIPEENIYTSGIHDNAVPLTVNEAAAVCNCVKNTCTVGLKYM